MTCQKRDHLAIWLSLAYKGSGAHKLYHAAILAMEKKVRIFIDDLHGFTHKFDVPKLYELEAMAVSVTPLIPGC